MSGLRVAIVGARAARQGLGPWVARHLAAAGAQVTAHFGTSAASARAAADDLRARAGVDSLPCTSAEQLLERGRPQALAILAPAEHHEHWLRFALEQRLPTLCEKPLVWGGARPADTARQLVTGFAEAGVPLLENCQWPETLPAYRELFGPPARAPASFFMRLSPARPAADMLGDALPHAVSLLQALAPCTATAPVSQVSFSTRDPAAEALQLSFRWAADEGAVQATVALERGPEQPREAAYGVDGRVARRYIRTSDYAQFLASEARLVNLPDPLARLLGRFLTTVAERDTTDAEKDRRAEAARMVQRMEALTCLSDAFHPAPR